MSAGSWLGWEDTQWMLVVPSHGLAPELCGSSLLNINMTAFLSLFLDCGCDAPCIEHLPWLPCYRGLWCGIASPLNPSYPHLFLCQNILSQPWKRDQNNIYSSKQVLRMQYTLSRSTSTYGWHPFPSWAEWNISVKNISSQQQRCVYSVHVLNCFQSHSPSLFPFPTFPLPFFFIWLFL